MKVNIRTCCLASITVLAVSTLLPNAIAAANPTMSVSSVTIGQNLQTQGIVELSVGAPTEGLQITLTSNDPKHLLLSTAADTAGEKSIVVKVFPGYRSSPQFFLFALGKSGVASYTASAPGYSNAQGKVTMAPSGILVAGWLNFGSPLVMTTGAMPLPIKVYAAQLDHTGNLVVVQPLRGGYSVDVDVTSSSPDIGKLQSSKITIQGGAPTGRALFKPGSPGETTFSIDSPAGFSKPAQYTTATVKVNLPGIGISDQIMVGENLQISGVLNLGELAPQSGVQVTLTSDDPSKLVISASETALGSKSVTMTVPANDNRATYYLQSLANSGKVTYTASAPGFRTRTATVTLAPSGVIITGPTGPPDEAEVLRPNDPAGSNGLFASVKSGETAPVIVYTAHLDPKTHRAADITVQPLRAGMSLTVDVVNANPVVGTTAERVTIPGGKDHALAHFKPLSVGSTKLSVAAPEGFTQPSNATVLTAIVRN